MTQITNVFGQVRGSFQYLINSWTTLVELMSIYYAHSRESQQHQLCRSGIPPGSAAVCKTGQPGIVRWRQ